MELQPQLCQLSRRLPAGAGWVYEPKWDGFRALVARLDGAHRPASPPETRLISRSGRELGAHYPELLELGRRLPPGTVLDGEIVAFVEGGLDFAALQYRLTMSGAQAALAASERPVCFVAFDLLRVEGEDLSCLALSERRRHLERLGGRLHAQPLLHVTPQTESRELAERWLLAPYTAAGVEGVVAKQAQQRYRPGERSWVKVKGERTLETVVRGYIGTPDRPRLVLGLYAGDGTLYSFGSTYPLRPSDARPLAGLEALRRNPEHPIWNRWQRQGFEGWTELPPLLVAEVSVTHVDQGRLRHSAHFRRWRVDVDARSCTAEQLRARGAGER